MSDIEDRFRELIRDRNITEVRASKERLEDESRNRLRKIVLKKIQTAFIGAMAKFEAHIGVELWGHGRRADQCTPEQLSWRKTWEECRNEILNHGNHQSRAIEAELQQYTMTWDRYQNTYPVTQKDQ